jgi:hypothetical protein
MRTDGHDQAHSRFSQFCQRFYKLQTQAVHKTLVQPIQFNASSFELLQHFRCTYNNQNCTSVLSTREINLRAAFTCVVLFTASDTKRLRQGSERCPSVEEDKMARGVQTNAYSARTSGCVPLLLSPASKFVDSFNRTLNI